MSLGGGMMMRRSGPWGCRCWDGGVPILRLDGAPFGRPILALERSDLEQLLVVLDLVFSVQPSLADDIVIRFENIDECCRGGCARLMTASRNSISSGVSLASSAIERADERDTSEMAERCVRAVV